MLNKAFVAEIEKSKNPKLKEIYKILVTKFSYRLLSQFDYLTGAALRSQRVGEAPTETDECTDPAAAAAAAAPPPPRRTSLPPQKSNPVRESSSEDGEMSEVIL